MNIPNQQLTEQSHPEPGISQGMGTLGHVRGNWTGARTIGTESSGADSRNGTQHLRCNESETHVDSSESLQKNDTEPKTLNGIQHAQPQPETARDERAGSVPADPGQVVSDAGDGPPDLDEAGCAQAAGKDGKEPTVSLGEFANDEEEDAPDKAEKDDAEEDNLPCVGVGGGP